MSIIIDLKRSFITTPHKEGKHAPAQSISFDVLTAESTSQLCPVDTDPLHVNIRPEVNNSPHSLLGLCDFDNKHLCSDIKEKETLNTQVNELSTVLHQKNSHCVDELSYKYHHKANNNSCNNIVSENSTNHNFSMTSLNFHMSLNKIFKNTNSHDNDNTQDSECDLKVPSPYFNDETLISSLKTKSQNFSIDSSNCQSLNAKNS